MNSSNAISLCVRGAKSACPPSTARESGGRPRDGAAPRPDPSPAQSARHSPQIRRAGVQRHPLAWFSAVTPRPSPAIVYEPNVRYARLAGDGCTVNVPRTRVGERDAVSQHRPATPKAAPSMASGETPVSAQKRMSMLRAPGSRSSRRSAQHRAPGVRCLAEKCQAGIGAPISPASSLDTCSPDSRVTVPTCAVRPAPVGADLVRSVRDLRPR